MYAAMPQCENIILGANYDNGYARILSKLETMNIMPGKVILLQGPGLAPELERIDTFLFPRIKFGELFMDKKLEGTRKYAQVIVGGKSPARSKSTSPGTSPGPPRLVEPELGILLKGMTNRRCVAFREKSFTESLQYVLS